MAFGAQIKLSVDKSNKSEFRGQIQQAVNAATANNPIKIKSVKIDLSAQERAQLHNQIRDALKGADISIKSIKIQHIDAKPAVNELRQQLKTMLSGLSITGLKEFLGDKASTEALEKATKATEKVAEAQKNLKKQATETAAALKEINTLQSSLDSANRKLLTMGTGENVEQLKQKYRELTEAIQQAKTATGEERAEAVRSASDGVSALNAEIAAIKEKEAAAKKAQSAAEKEAKSAEASAAKEASLARQTASFRQQINTYISKNTTAYKTYGAQIDAILAQLSSESEITRIKLSELKTEFLGIKASADAAGISGQTFMEKLRAGWEKFGGWSVITKSMMTAIRSIKSMVSAVKELDLAMTELRKVTDLTTAGYENFYKTVVNVASEVGAKVSDTINATADFARLGFTVEDATELAKAALVYKNVGDGIEDISEATESLISTMKAFGVEANDSMRIVDEFNEVGNRFAISSVGIGDALKRSAAALSAAGSSLEESIGLIVAANNVVQNPDQVGTALKTLSMYLRAAKTEAQEAGEEVDGMANSVSELRDEILALTNGKVDIQLDENTFKTPFQILKELSKVWDSLTDITRANITELIGGKRNANIISAIMGNFADAEKAAKTALNSIGSSAKENEKYLSSIAGKADVMAGKFQNLAHNLIDSNLVKFVIDAAGTGIDMLNGLIDLFGAFPTIVGAATAALEVFGKSIGFSQYKNGTLSVFGADILGGNNGFMSGISNATHNLGLALKTLFSGLTSDQKALVQFNADIKNGISVQDAFAANMAHTSKEAQDMATQIAMGDATLEGFGISAAGAAIKLNLMNIGMKALSAAINIGITMLVSWGISALVNFVSEIVHAGDAAKEAAEAGRKAAKETTESVQDAIDKYVEYKTALDKGDMSQQQFNESVQKVISSLAQQGETIDELIEKYGNLDKAMLNASKNELEVAENGLISAYNAARDELKDAFSGILSGSITIWNQNTMKAAAIDTIEELLEQSGFKVIRDMVGGWGYTAERSATLSLNKGEYNLKTIEGIISAYNDLYEVLNLIKSVEGGTETYFYEQAYGEWQRLDALISNYKTALTDYYENIISRSVIDQILSEGIPETKEQFDALREAVVESVEATGKYSEEANSVGLSIDGMVDSVLAAQSAFSGFIAETITSNDVMARTKVQALDVANTLKQLKEGYDILNAAQKEMSENGSISMDTLGAIAGQLSGNEKLTDYLYYENGLLKLNADAWEQRNKSIIESKQQEYLDAVIDINNELKNNTELTENQANELRQRANEYGVMYKIIGLMVKELNKADVEVSKSVTDVLSVISSTSSFLTNVGKDGTDALDLIQSAISLASKVEGADWKSFIKSFSEDGIEWNTEAIRAFSDELVANNEHVQELEAVYPGITAYLQNMAAAEAEAAKEAMSLSDALGVISSASTFLTNMGKEGTDALDMIQSAISLASKVDGKEWTDFVKSFSETGGIEWDADAIREFTDALVDQIPGITELEAKYPGITQALKDMSAAEAEAAEESVKLGEALRSSIDSGKNVGRNTGITEASLKSLLDTDARYLDTLEYVNGQLVINRDRYNDVTDAILQETLAEIEAAAKAIILSEEYQNLAKNEANLTKEQRKRLNELNVEITSYAALANELQNATSAYQRFMNASSDDSKGRYAQAVNALQVITDTLENVESDIYGKIGRDHFKLAVDFVLGENVDIDTAEFQRGLETVKRYLTKDAQGVTNFYDDLVSHGIIDATTGAFDTTIAEISEKLNISQEAVRAMMEELERYQKEPFDWEKLDPGSDAEKAKSSIETLQEATAAAQETADVLKAEIDELNTTKVELDVSSAVSAAGSLSSALQGILDLLSSIAKNSKISITASVTKQQTSLLGSLFSGLFGKSSAGGTENAPGGKTLVGELGPEIVVDPKTGTWHTVGTRGPEFVNLNPGSIVLNAKQTADLLGNGTKRSSGPSKAFAANVILSDGGGGGSTTKTTTQQVTIPQSIQNVVGGFFNALADGVKALGDAANKYNNDKASGTATRPNTGNKNNNNGGGGSSGPDPKKLKEEYDELNKQLEHLIEHQEYLYKVAERGLDFPGMRASLEEQARLYKEIMDNAYEAVEKMKQQGLKDTDEELQDMERAAWSTYESMYDAFDKIRALYTDALSQKIDDIQTAYGNLKSAMDEIDDGGLSLDTFQALTEHGLQYLSFLKDTNGQYKINAEAIQKMVAAEKEQLAIETALSYISSLQEALRDGQENRINALVDATQQISDNTWSAVYAQAAMLRDLGLSGEQYDQVIFNINALRDLSGQVVTDMTGEAEAGSRKVKDVFTDVKKELDHLIEHQEQLYAEAERGMNFDGMEASLREQAKLYKQIMNEAYAAVEEMKRQGMTDVDEDLQEMERAAWSAYASMNDAFDQMRALYTDALHEKLDDIQKGYEDLKNVMEEIQEQGGITVDTFQEIAEHGLQYMSFLKDAEGQYEINADRIQALVAAEKEQLAIETALSYVSSLQEALSEGQLNRVNALVDATQQVSDNTWNAVYAQVAMLKTLGLTEEQYEQVIFNIETFRDLSMNVITDITEKQKSVKDIYDEMNSELDHLIEHQQFYYSVAEHGMDYSGMENSLREQARLYKQIMENAYRAVEEMKQQGMTDLDEDLQAMERTAWSAYNSMYDAFDKIRALHTDALHGKIDDIQKGYRNLKDALDEIAESGGITIDTFQALTQHGLQYMSFLEGANGQYEINTASIQKMIEAEKEQLAIETALAYLSSLQEALQNGQDDRINALVDATQQISANSWSAVYAQAALLREMGLTQAQYEQVIYNIETMRDLASQVVTDISDRVEENFDDQKDALDKILRYTQDLVREEIRGRIKAIEREVKAYKSIIDMKKESLKLSKDQDKYERDLADKVEEIGKIQAKIDKLSLDDSRSANAERTKLIEELAKLQGDLTDYQADHAYEAQVNTLDKMAQSYEDERQKEIDILESSISSTEKIYQMALERIRTSWNTLYTDLIEWNTEYGSVINQEITENWNLAGEAVQRYGSYIRALQELGGFDVGGSLAVLPKYHGGGVVGDAGSINDSEAMAILQKGEVVLDDTKKKGLYRIIDFQKALSEKLGVAIGNIALAGSSIMHNFGFGGAAAEKSVEGAQNVVYSPTINVAINHNGSMDSEDARRYGKDIADTALDRMYSAFERRGISGIFGTRMKQA